MLEKTEGSMIECLQSIFDFWSRMHLWSENSYSFFTFKILSYFYALCPQVRLNSNFDTFKSFSISANTDLNNLKDAGFYFSPNSSVSSTLSNTPVSGSGFVMLVMEKGTTSTQTIMTGSAMYSRTATSSGWGGWYKYDGTAV